MKGALRILHVLALGTAVLGFGAAVWGWLHSHPLGDVGGRDLANLGGLGAGFVLGVVLLWGALRPGSRNLKAAIVLYACWIGIFGWYWFSRFAVRELHGLDAAKVELERARQTVVSIAVFLLWACLCSIGPVLRARRLRHRLE